MAVFKSLLLIPLPLAASQNQAIKGHVVLGMFHILALPMSLRTHWKPGNGIVSWECPPRVSCPLSRQAGTLQGSCSASHAHRGCVSAWCLHEGWLPRVDHPVLSSSLILKTQGPREENQGAGDGVTEAQEVHSEPATSA